MTLAVRGSLSSHDFDEEGIPKIYYRRLSKSAYNPVYISMYGLMFYQKWLQTHEFDYFLRYYRLKSPKLSGDDPMLTGFLGIANWLVKNMTLKNDGTIDFGVWEYDFPWKTYNLESPWVSGMAQGVAIQVLIRAWIMSGQDRYLSRAKLARNAFYVAVKDGGVTYKDSENEWWYEEYAAPHAVESRVLNGMEHALIALYELHTLAGDDQAGSLFNKGITSLRNRIWKYDSGWWTYYDQIGSLANLKYHHINVNLTRKLYAITGDKQLFKACEKWKRYKSHFFIREFIRQKPNYVDITILSLNLIGVYAVLLVLFVLIGAFKRRGPVA